MKTASWDVFGREIVERLARLPVQVEDTPGSVETRAVALQRAILGACDRSIKRRRLRARPAPWWNSDLRTLRKEVNVARKRYQALRRRNSTQKVVEEAKEAFYSACKRYKKAIRRAKLQTWRHFVSEVGNEDPWGILYRILKEKNPKREAYHSVTLDTGGRTLDWRETAARILEILLLTDGDPLSSDHVGIARIAREYESHYLAPAFTRDEVNVAIYSLKSGKAPGRDLIEVEVLKRLWKAPLPIS